MVPSFGVVFVGQNNEFSLTCYHAIACRFPLAGVIESAPRQPNKVGGPMRVIQSLRRTETLAEAAARKNVPFLRLIKGGDLELGEFLREVNPQVVCVVSMSQLIPVEALSIPKHGFINLHPSLLPEYRGPNPWWWQVYDGITMGGVTVHLLDAGEDTGPILGQCSFPIELGMAPRLLIKRAADAGARLMVEVMQSLQAGTATPYPQPEPQRKRRARNIKPGERLIDWENWSIQRVYHVLATGAPWYDWRDPNDWLLRRFAWRATGFTLKPCNYPAGTMHIDWRGWYIAHSQGRIRIAPFASVRRLFRFLSSWAEAKNR